MRMRDIKVNMSMMELEAMQQLENIIPYDYLFVTLRDYFKLTDDSVVAQRLISFRSIYPNVIDSKIIDNINTYLISHDSLEFNVEWLTGLTTAQVGLLDEDNDDDVQEWLKELNLIYTYLVQTVDCGSDCDNELIPAVEIMPGDDEDLNVLINKIGDLSALVSDHAGDEEADNNSSAEGAEGASDEEQET